MAAAACLAARAVFSAPAITNVTVGGGNALLQWDVPTNRFIVETITALTDTTWQCTASSAGSTASSISASLGNASNVFYRLQFGLQVVNFPDTNLEKAVRSAITSKHSPTNKIYDVDLYGIVTFTAGSKNISNLTGLASMRDLRSLQLLNNKITDISSLTGPTNLVSLGLYGNHVTNLNLATFPTLGELNLGTNQLTNIGFLTGAVSLQTNVLTLNSITNLTPLTGLTNLTWLDLSYNSASNLTPLVGLKKLRFLDLSYNRFVDLAPLITNAQQGGLGSNDVLYVTGDPLTSFATTNQIPTLRNTYGLTVFGP